MIPSYASILNKHLKDEQVKRHEKTHKDTDNFLVTVEGDG
jgi:hypothetical protein